MIGYIPRTTPLCDFIRLMMEIHGGEQVCSGRVAVGLHRRNALAPGAGTDAPFSVFAPTESER